MPQQTGASLYDRIAGEPGVRRVVEIFYDIVEQHPEGRELNILHLCGHGVAHSRIEQSNFLSGFLGGPNLYAQKHGHSSVREVHEHVEINARVRDAWLTCISMALDRAAAIGDTKEAIMAHFRVVTHSLKNVG